MIQTLFPGSQVRRRKQLLRVEKAREMERLNNSGLLEDSFFAKMAFDLLDELRCAGSLPDPLFISAYWPLGPSEVQTQFLLHRLHEAGYRCLLPIPLQQPSPLLGFAPWDPDTVLVEGPLRTLVPENFAISYLLKPHLMLMPMLAFDQAGYRLGRGGGYYDATLRFLRFQAGSFFLAVGIAHSSQEISSVPRELHDEKMDALLTENKCFWF
ncbi:MAG: 5-formyltetrahydrofolate cyclo-ligase [Alphaproteobacteria bacterium]